MVRSPGGMVNTRSNLALSESKRVRYGNNCDNCPKKKGDVGIGQYTYFLVPFDIECLLLGEPVW